MVVTVFGATGQVGRRIVQYALAQGMHVRAFGRNVNNLIDPDLQNEKLQAIKGSVFDDNEVLGAVTGSDAVLSALGGGFDGTDKTRSLGMKKIVAQMNKAGVQRIVALGGSGVLDAPGGGYVLDEPEYPAEFLPVGREHLQAFLHLKNSNLEWTFVCSPTILDEDKTEHYNVSISVSPNSDKHEITAGDLAHFMVKELQQPEHVRERVGISAV